MWLYQVPRRGEAHRQAGVALAVPCGGTRGHGGSVALRRTAGGSPQSAGSLNHGVGGPMALCRAFADKSIIPAAGTKPVLRHVPGSIG
jgi:hypothetical protein